MIRHFFGRRMKETRGTRTPVVAVLLTGCALALLPATVCHAQAFGSAVSPVFELYLGPGFVRPAPNGASSAVSPAFELYLGPEFVRPAPNGASSAVSPAFELWLGRLSESFALSPAFSLDMRVADPGFVTPPSGLTASRGPCGMGVELRWTETATDQTGFEVDGKVAGFSDIWYERVKAVGPTNRTFLHLPYDGLARTYRVRAIRGQVVSAYSNEAPGPAPPIPGTTKAPASLSVKSIGDGNGLRVHFMPPGNTTQWDGTSWVEIDQATSTNFERDLVATQSNIYSGSGEQTVRFEGLHDVPSYFRARIVPSCGEPSPYVSAEPLAPRHAPVLLVHGIWGSAADWGSVWSTALATGGFDAGRVRAVNFKACGDTWVAWGDELRTTIPAFLEPDSCWGDDESVDIIAYSQGGLASRYYVERLGGVPRVRTLVMIATPNHGGKFSTLASVLHFFEVMSKGVRALGSNSTALRDLNFEDVKQHDGACEDMPCDAGTPCEHIQAKKGTVEYYTIAGTGPSMIYCGLAGVVDPLYCQRQSVTDEDPGDCASDGVVTAQSVYLRALPADHQKRDVDIGAGGTAHIPKLAVEGASKAILESKAVASWAVRLLREPNAHDQAPLSEPLPSPVEALISVGEDPATRQTRPANNLRASATSDSLCLLASVTDSLPGGVIRSYAIPSDSMRQLIVFGSWQDSTLALRLRGPDATLYAPADTVGRPWLHYERNDMLGYAAFAVDDPMPGSWSAEVEAPSGAYMAHHQVDWIAKWGGYRLAAELDKDVLLPGDTLSLTASLLSQDGPVEALCSAVLLTPAGGTDSLALHDDGMDGDVAAGDGIYSARYVASLSGGDYSVRLVGRATVGESTTQRTSTSAFSVIAGPDLALDSLQLCAAPAVSAVEQLTELRAMIHNRGFTVADSAAIAFEDASTGEALGTMKVLIPARDSVETRILWTPHIGGEHTIRVTATLLGTTEGGVSDNSADLLVPVAAAPPAAGVESAPVQPARFELAAPRPNPFRQAVNLDFAVPRFARVVIEVFDVQGRRMKRVLDETLAPGRYTRSWRGDDASGRSVQSGMFFVRFTAPGFIQTRRAVLIR